MTQMKKIHIYFAMLLVIGIILSSCYRDESSLDLAPITGIGIDTTGMTELFVYQFEDLVVEPELDLGDLSEKDVSYEWRINLKAGDTVYEVIGEERNLRYEVTFKPNVSGNFHQVWYAITDHTTGLDYIMTWPLTVRNNIGEGLVIAESYDGVTTDISHIMAPEVTADHTDVSVKREVYSAINGGTIDGIVKQMRHTRMGREDIMMGITDNSIFKINTLDYTMIGINDDLFYGNPGTYEPQALGGIVQGDMYIGSGRMTGTYLGASLEFGPPLDFPYVVPDHVAFNAHNNSPPVMVNFYDEVNEHFVYLPTIAAWGDNSMHPVAADPDGSFNPADLQNKENLVAEVSNTGEFRHLLKDKETGEVGLYILNGGQSVYPDIISPAPLAYYDLSNIPGIGNASHFTFLDNQRVMYYVVDNTIYALLYGGGTPVSEERYTAPAGEQITTLQVYRQADYPSRSNDIPYLETHNRQLIMSTYGSEGKVYLLPFVNTGVGNIDQTRIKAFDGFGRISAIATQL